MEEAVTVDGLRCLNFITQGKVSRVLHVEDELQRLQVQRTEFNLPPKIRAGEAELVRMKATDLDALRCKETDELLGRCLPPDITETGSGISGLASVLSRKAHTEAISKATTESATGAAEEVQLDIEAQGRALKFLIERYPQIDPHDPRVRPRQEEEPEGTQERWRREGGVGEECGRKELGEERA